MKNPLTLLCLMILLAACAPAANPGTGVVQQPGAASVLQTTPPTPASSAAPKSSDTPEPSATISAPASILSSSLQASAGLSPAQNNAPSATLAGGFTDPDPETWVKIMSVVREYFYYRKEAILSGSVAGLWKRYPALKQDADFSTGVNSEERTVNNYGSVKPFDGNIFPEYYEKIKVNSFGGNTQVLAHGLELYLYHAEAGRFDDSGGEFKIILFLRSQGDQWELYQTQDISGP